MTYKRSEMLLAVECASYDNLNLVNVPGHIWLNIKKLSIIHFWKLYALNRIRNNRNLYCNKKLWWCKNPIVKMKFQKLQYKAALFLKKYCKLFYKFWKHLNSQVNCISSNILSNACDHFDCSYEIYFHCMQHYFITHTHTMTIIKL